MNIITDYIFLIGVSTLSSGIWLDNQLGYSFKWPYKMALIGLVITLTRLVILVLI